MERSKQLNYYYRNKFSYKQYYINNRLKILEKQKLYKERVDKEYKTPDNQMTIKYGKFWVHFD